MCGRISPATAHREAVIGRPSVPAQVHHGLAHAIPGQLGLGAVRIVDAHLGHAAALIGLADQQNAVRADPGVRRADRAHAPGSQLERQLTFLDDHIIVAQRLPLLDVHGAGTLREGPAQAPGSVGCAAMPHVISSSQVSRPGSSPRATIFEALQVVVPPVCVLLRGVGVGGDRCG